MEVGSALPTTSTGFYNERHSKSEKTFILKIQRPRRQPCDGGRERRWGTSHGSWKHHERPQSIQVTLLGISDPCSSFHHGASRSYFKSCITYFIANILSNRFKLSPDLKYVMLAFRPQRLFRWLSSPLHFVFLSKPTRFSCTALHFHFCTLSWSFPLSGTPSSPSTTSTTSPPAGWSIELSWQRFFVNT